MSERNDKLQTQVKDIQNELGKKDQYIADIKERLENQISNLLKEKINIETQYNSTFEMKEKQYKDTEKQLNETIEQLKNKDILLSKIRSEKELVIEEKNELEIKKNTQIQTIQDQSNNMNVKHTKDKEKLEQQIVKLEKSVNNLVEEKLKLENELNEIQNNLNNKSGKSLMYNNR